MIPHNIAPFIHKLPSAFAPSIYGYKNQLHVKQWYSCRDGFHQSVSPTSLEGFFYGTSDPAALSVFFDWVENVLNIKPKYRLKIHVCGKDKNAAVNMRAIRPVTGYAADVSKNATICFIELSDFWREERWRFTFLTILCRAHDLGTWLHPLDNLTVNRNTKTVIHNQYTNSSRRATAMFLDGYTCLDALYKGTATNWVALFAGDSLALRHMSRPSSSNDLRFFNDEDCRSRLTPAEKWRLQTWVREQDSSSMEKFSF